MYERYGSPDVVEIISTAVPAPGPRQVLVKVRAASVNPYDWHLMRGQPYLVRIGGGLRRPKSGALGSDLAGRVEAVGSDVTRFEPGDEVFGMSRGTLAEYVSVREDGLVHKPANVGFEQAAAVPVSALTALQGLRDKGGIRAGQRVLIVGGSGGVGTFAVQLAKAFGAEVTAVTSGRNAELVRSIGADRVIDYERDDFAREADRYDLVFDGVGDRSVRDLRRVLAPGGVLVFCGAGKSKKLGPIGRLVTVMVAQRRGDRSMRMFMAQRSQTDLELMRELLASGKVVPVIDRRYALEDTAEAIRYLETGHARGKVIVIV